MMTDTSILARRSPAVRRNREFSRYRSTATTIGPVSLTLMLSLITGVLALLYLTQITKTSVYGYQVNVLSTQQEELVQRNQELAVEAARLRSLDRIKKSEVAKNLEQEQHVSYIPNQSN